MPKVTAAVPVYNVRNYLEKCVFSILSQAEGDLELLLIDDGSTDGSSQLCDELALRDPRVRVIHQENQGLGGARNTGIENAQGEWILFPDSDDWLEPETLSTALRAAERTGAELSFFAFRSVDETGNTIAEFHEVLPEGVLLLPRDHRDLILAAPSACTKLYKTELFRRTGVRYPPRVWYEDVRTTTKLIPDCRGVVYTDFMGYNYLQRGGSIMNNSNLERNREILDAFEDVLGWYKKQGLFEAYRTELLHLTVSHVYLTSSVRVLRQDPQHPLLREFREFVKREFPDYRSDIYRDRFTSHQRLAMTLLEKRMTFLLNWLFRIHDRLK